MTHCNAFLHVPRLTKLAVVARDVPDLPIIIADAEDAYPCELETEHQGRHQVDPVFAVPVYKWEWALKGNAEWEATESFKVVIRQWQAWGRPMPHTGWVVM